MIEWRIITEKDYYDILVKWWTDWGWDYYPLLSDCPRGYIVSKDGVDTYASFLYYSGTSIAWLGFTISNKNATVEQKRGCFSKLMEVITIIAKNNGVKTIFANAQGKDYRNTLIKNDFIIGDTGVTHLIKKI